jgi:adenosylcobinamide-GDP ribazoletransferase
VRRALSFLTPLFGARQPSPTALLWFPIVGALLGAVVGVVWWAADRIWPASVAALIVVVADLALTGMLHFDGLVDSADGLLPHLTPERRLEVMAEPTTGAFGLAVGAMVLALRAAALAVIGPSALLLAGLWCGSRTLMAVTITRVPYARSALGGSGGLASAFLGAPIRPIAAEGVLSAVVLAALWRPFPGAVSVLAGVAAGIGVVRLAQRRIGGFTGDVLGAAGMVTETVGLLVAAGWRR